MATRREAQYWRLVRGYINTQLPQWRVELNWLARDFINTTKNAAMDFNAFKRYSDKLIKGVEGAVDTRSMLKAEAEVRTGIDGLLNSASDSVEELYTASVAKMDEFSESIFDGADTALTGIGDLAGGIWDRVIKTYDQTTASLEGIYDDSVNYIEQSYNDTWNALVDTLNLVNDQIEAVYGGVASRLNDSYKQFSESYTDIVDDTITGINDFLEETAFNLNSVIEESLESVSGLAGEFAESADAVSDSLGNLTDKLVGDITPSLAVLAKAATSYLGFIDTPENRETLKKTESSFKTYVMKLLDPNDNLLESIMSSLDESENDSIFGAVMYQFMAIAMSVPYTAQALNILASPKATKTLHGTNALYPVQDYSISEVAQLAARRLIDEQTAVNSGLKQGYDEKKTKTFVEAGQVALDIERLNAAYNRQFIDRDRYIAGLKKGATRDSDIDIIDRLRVVLPPVQDLITMAVREVFSDEIADKFQLFEDLPKEFVRQAAKQGLPEETAKWYWGAHWRLPSALQGFEMFHREVIDSETLDMHLKALDVSPFWRDKLKAIAYNVITRVDIRRIYKLRLIDRAEVVKRHRHIGYSPEDSELMADFVQSYVGFDDEDDDVDAKRLTFSLIKRLWSLGTVDKESAISQLLKIGYAPDQAELLVVSWSTESEVSFRESLINRYVRKAIRDDMDDVEIETLFSGLEMTVKEMDRVRKVIEVEQSEFDKIPTFAQLRNMVLNKIITYERWYKAMRQLGYGSEWIDNLATLYKIEVSNAR